jgi:rod shape-determining protein MreC
MIGRIFLTGDHTSWVILLTDLNSRIPVTIEPGNVQAIMAGDNTGAPTLDLLSQNVMLKPGMQVVSSGDGGLLPPGLAIGTVVADPDGGFRVVLLADAASSEDVNVVDFKQRAELPPSVSPNDLPATAAGLPLAPPPAPVVATPPGAVAPGTTAPGTTTPAPSPLPSTTIPKPAAHAGAAPAPPTPVAPDATDPGDE